MKKLTYASLIAISSFNCTFNVRHLKKHLHKWIKDYALLRIIQSSLDKREIQHEKLISCFTKIERKVATNGVNI